ncbi:MAG: ATP-binding cassette domain-containing protein [Treponemataceae bacterium]|nr:ATP-binding cassette domain-containing protein [Treponemataceae bacterium]
MTILECRDVSVQYGSFTACRNVCFSVAEGDYLCIVGANGSGKTTIVKAALGLVGISGGEIVRTNARIGYLPQQNSIQRDFPASVHEVVLSGCVKNRRLFHGRADREDVRRQLARLGISALERRPFRSLSGGQQQRVLLARALCAAGNLLVLDEPVTGLDPVVTDELYAAIRRLNKEDRLAVLMVSHDVRRAVENATHILQMAGRPLFFGSADEYRASQLYKDMSGVEVCGTHLGQCGANCHASHIHIPGDYSHD